MRHPTDGALRRLVDEPAGVADADRAHVAGCPACLGGLAAAREDAAAVGAALPRRPRRADVDAGVAPARRRPRRRAARRRRPPRRRRARRRAAAALRSPVVAALGVVARARRCRRRGRRRLAADLPAPRRSPPVQVTSADLVALPDLSAYGDVAAGRRSPDVHAVRRRAAAARRDRPGRPAGARPAGRGHRRADLPRRRPGDRRLHLLRRRAAQAAAAAGESLPPVPAGPGRQPVPAGRRARAWLRSGRRPAGCPALVVARAAAPTAFSVRRLVRDRARLPAVAARHARRTSRPSCARSPRTAPTLPLPVPAELATTLDRRRRRHAGHRARPPGTAR